MYTVGITGGIGSGKSTVTESLKDKGFKVIDADEISREITRNGSHAVTQLAGIFGDFIIDSPGVLNRKKLAAIVFKDPEKKKELDGFMMIRIISEINAQMMRLADERLIFLDAPLLYETELDKVCDEVWVIDAPLKKRLERVSQRDAISEEDVMDRVKNQLPDDKKLKLADVVLDNSGTCEELKDNILKELSELEGRIDIYEQENDEEIDDRISGDPFLDLL